jgi:hypothetical protein
MKFLIRGLLISISLTSLATAQTLKGETTQGNPGLSLCGRIAEIKSHCVGNTTVPRGICGRLPELERQCALAEKPQAPK